ncbi:hypothetical protein BKA62DRAFT_436053 [Auriculariales sp. MPI-PUGE-AT-0066]|nr:hypothetical protein BKA62DRAFT_436053 [Auriculariales sp. MPI-PUGE-AT-0066]
MRSLLLLAISAVTIGAVEVDWKSIQTKRGDVLPDFSYVGYRQGDHKLPSSQPRNASAIIAASESSSEDQTSAIQKALDDVAAAGGGVVELAAGKHYLSGSATISIGTKTWLRGADKDKTVVVVKGSPRSVFTLGAADVKAITGASSNITTSYVPIGALQLVVQDASVFKVNQTVYVQRPAAAAWIRANGMADLVRDGKPQVWIKAGTLFKQPRIIQSIDGNTLDLDIPLTDSIEKKYSVGSVQVYSAKGINNAGVENFQIQLSPSCSGAPITDPDCAGYTAVSFQPFTVDSWALNLTMTGFVAGFVRVAENAQRITLENLISVRDAVSDGSAGWGADISIGGTQVLVKNCASQATVDGARSFAVALGGQVAGPNAILNHKAALASQIVQPHMRWAHGLLVDRSQAGVELINRNTAGSGHGWTINAGVAWNSDAAWRAESPPLGVNWAVGMRGTKGSPSNATEIATGESITPASLYTAQLQARRAAARAF